MYLSDEAVEFFNSSIATSTKLNGKLSHYGKEAWSRLRISLEEKGCTIVRNSGGADYRELVFRDPLNRGHRLKMLVHDSVQVCVILDGKNYGYIDDSLEEMFYQAVHFLLDSSCLNLVDTRSQNGKLSITSEA